MTMDATFKVCNIIAWLAVALTFYFTSQAETTTDVFKVNERVSVLEQQIQQEVLGYNVLQSSIGQRLDRIERKVDCLIDKRLCH